jgi:transposase-like protein
MDPGKESAMGKVRRKFTIGFKQQVVQEVEAGLITKIQAARKYELSAGAIERWIWKYRDGTLVEKPTTEEKALKAENERLKAKIGELTMQIDLLKKLEAYAQQRRKENTSVITLRNLAQFQGGAK